MSQLSNQEIITAVEEWVDENEEYSEEYDEWQAPSLSLITFLKKLLHE